MNIVTANRLLDGKVIYRTREGTWVETFAQAARFSAQESEVALEAAQIDVTLVVKPYLVPLEDADTFAKRERNRESIRANGPSVLRKASPAREKGA